MLLVKVNCCYIFACRFFCVYLVWFESTSEKNEGWCLSLEPLTWDRKNGGG